MTIVADGWCPVSAVNAKGEAVAGWIYEGCLSVETERKCEAMP